MNFTYDLCKKKRIVLHTCCVGVSIIFIKHNIMGSEYPLPTVLRPNTTRTLLLNNLLCTAAL